MSNIQVAFLGSRQLEQALVHFSLSHQPLIEIVVTTNDSVDIFYLLEQYGPKLLLIEITQDQTNIFDLVQNIRTHFPQVKLLLLANRVDVVQIRRLIMIGIAGCLLVGPSLEGPDISISLINNGKLTLDAQITQALLSAK